MTDAPNNPRSAPALDPHTAKNTSIVDDLPTRSIDLSAPQYRSDGDLINIAGYPRRQSDEIFLSLLTQAFNDNTKLVKKLGYHPTFTSAPPTGFFLVNFSKIDKLQFPAEYLSESSKRGMMQVVGHPSDMAYSRLEDFAVHVFWIVVGKVGYCDCVLCVKGDGFD